MSTNKRGKTARGRKKKKKRHRKQKQKSKRQQTTDSTKATTSAQGSIPRNLLSTSSWTTAQCAQARKIFLDGAVIGSKRVCFGHCCKPARAIVNAFAYFYHATPYWSHTNKIYRATVHLRCVQILPITIQTKSMH